MGLTPNEVLGMVGRRRTMKGDPAPTDKVPVYNKPKDGSTPHIIGYKTVARKGRAARASSIMVCWSRQRAPGWSVTA